MVYLIGEKIDKLGVVSLAFFMKQRYHWWGWKKDPWL